MKNHLSLPQFCRQYRAPSDRVNYFKGYPVAIERELMTDDEKGRSWARPLTYHYRPVCRNVRIGDWQKNADQAKKEGRKFISRWDGKIRENERTLLTQHLSLRGNCFSVRSASSDNA